MLLRDTHETERERIVASYQRCEIELRLEHFARELAASI